MKPPLFTPWGGAGSGAEKLYTAWGDFMTRNPLGGVEVPPPVLDGAGKQRIRHIFDTVMRDDEKGKELQADGSYADRHLNEPPLNSQELFYDEAYRAAGRAGEGI